MSEPTKLVIAGAGGLGREILATVRACNQVRERWNILGFLDSNPALTGKNIAGVAVLGGDDWLQQNWDESFCVICAIGNGVTRRRAVERFAGFGCKFGVVVHPDVNIPESVRIGAGTVIMAGTRFTTDAVIGSHVVIYVNCSIPHDVVIDDYCVVASGCNLSGAVTLEAGVELGTGSSILPGKRIGAWSVIGAGSVVINDIPPHVTAAGVPCKVIKSRSVF